MTLSRTEALRIAIECLNAHSIGPAGVFTEAAAVLAEIRGEVERDIAAQLQLEIDRYFGGYK